MAPFPQPTNAQQATPTITVLVTTFTGLGLPRTLSLPTNPNTSVSDLTTTILNRLPHIDRRLIITTNNNKQLLQTSDKPISTLLQDEQTTLLPLRLSARLCGGKGGFGSQLRAAGGRMSSKKNRDRNAGNPNGSNRNLDGRRLRTVDEAKRLADYLATKPEMEKRERDEKRKRWEAVVEAAERKEEEVRSGRAGNGGGRLDAQYVEGKEEAERITREAVIRAMKEGNVESARTGSESSEDRKGSEEDGAGSSQGSTDSPEPDAHEGPSFFGWDDDELSEDEGDDVAAEPVTPGDHGAAVSGKGKGKA
ncbi:hypothetical protein MBLNU230_g2937t1 [Neophaeotheca triangularis]